MRIVYVEKLSLKCNVYIHRCGVKMQTWTEQDWANSRKYKQMLIETLTVSRWNAREPRLFFIIPCINELELAQQKTTTGNINSVDWSIPYWYSFRTENDTKCHIGTSLNYHFNDKIGDWTQMKESFIFPSRRIPLE